jgi:hypothetical protein
MGAVLGTRQLQLPVEMALDIRTVSLLALLLVVNPLSDPWDTKFGNRRFETWSLDHSIRKH